jgi:hypothetical protein
MSQENLAIARSAVAAFNSRDIPALEALYADEFELRVIGGLADMTGTEFREEAATAWIEDLVATVGGFLEIDMLRAVGDQVLLIGTLHTSGSSSGAVATLEIGQVFSFRRSRICALDSYYRASEAVEAVGLEE